MEPNWQAAIVTLVTEAFEGLPKGKRYTWFVEGHEGILDVFKALNAEEASRKLSEDASSVAGHMHHLRFILRHCCTVLGMPKPEGTWESSWAKQSVTDEEWADLGAEVTELYELALGWFKSNSEWASANQVIGATAFLPHVSFHLGAMRQMVRIVKG